MNSTLAIGDFSRATLLSVKTLRHYHDVGLLEPAEIDPDTGYRRYAPGQIATAQVIRRFRDVDMPLDNIHAVLTAPNIEARNQLIAAHLARLEATLTRTQTAVAALRDILEQPPSAAPIHHRQVPATTAAAITATVDRADVLIWYRGALGELKATAAAQQLEASGPAGGMFANELFTEGEGQATIFLQCASTVQPIGRVVHTMVPSVELATIVHSGTHTGIDRAYGALGAYVTQHALAVDGPLREYYLVSPTDTDNEASWRTEVGWPIFQTQRSG